MTLYTKDDIVESAKKLAEMIAQTEQVELFKKSEEALNKNEKVHEMIEEIKKVQKQAVNFQHYKKTEALKRAENLINSIQDELDAIPVIQQFKESQLEVNDLLQLVANTITNSVTDEILKSTGGDVLRGETGSQVEVASNSTGDACCNS